MIGAVLRVLGEAFLTALLVSMIICMVVGLVTHSVPLLIAALVLNGLFLFGILLGRVLTTVGGNR